MSIHIVYKDSTLCGEDSSEVKSWKEIESITCIKCLLKHRELSKKIVQQKVDELDKLELDVYATETRIREINLKLLYKI